VIYHNNNQFLNSFGFIVCKYLHWLHCEITANSPNRHLNMVSEYGVHPTLTALWEVRYFWSAKEDQQLPVLWERWADRHSSLLYGYLDSGSLTSSLFARNSLGAYN